MPKYGVSAPASAKPGSSIQVKWTGPNNPGDYVTIVAKDAPVGEYKDDFYTKSGNPGTLKMPTQPGSDEIRYSSEKASPNPTLSSVGIEVR